MPKLIFKRSKLLLVEGRDAWNFFIWALKAYNIASVQVQNFGGITQLRTYLETIKLIDGFDNVETLLIARDAETNAKGAVASIASSLKNAGFNAPVAPFEFTRGRPKTCFMLFPGYNSKGVLENGALEDLCLKTIEDNVILSTEKYLKDIEENHHTLIRRHKSKLYAYLSVKNAYVGAKLGEAAKIGAWNWESDIMKPFKDILENA